MIIDLRSIYDTLSSPPHLGQVSRHGQEDRRPQLKWPYASRLLMNYLSVPFPSLVLFPPSPLPLPSSSSSPPLPPSDHYLLRTFMLFQFSSSSFFSSSSPLLLLLLLFFFFFFFFFFFILFFFFYR
ncbi:hypothetical protein SprV_0100214100 [Sparganum proliferum]